ncbi:MAG: hypothetical protein EOP55_03715 [Sphingobacteriales bacterium]|nr:MAG: hypothetical protein EOP55_03715 [Sphingobacteriales bacterium]
MKNLTFILLALVFASCNTKSENTTSSVHDSSSVVTSSVMVDSAKLIIDETSSIMEKGIKGKMDTAEINKQIKPLMAEYNRIYKTLSPADTVNLYAYRMKKVSEMMELQQKQSKK